MEPLGTAEAGVSRTPTRRIRALVTLAVLTLLLAGCGLQIPADPDGTEDRVRGGTMNVGVTHNPPHTDTESNADPVGREIELVQDFAAELDADIAWVEGSEASLVNALERGELDLVIGGFLEQTPWAEKAAVSRWYTEIQNERGEREKYVMLTRMGENRFLVSLETFLDGVGQ